MRFLTPSERRGAVTVVLLLAIGTARDLWVASHPRPTPAPALPAPPAAGTAPAAEPHAPPARGQAPDRAVDLNRADERELDSLPGIGPVLAERIVAHRKRFGPFTRAEDLLAVPGVGPRLLERLRARVTVGPGPAGGPGRAP